jgi:hypothetical protein
VDQSRPPWASTIERQIERPMPMPLGLVVKKALNNRSAFSDEIPTPQSTHTCGAFDDLEGDHALSLCALVPLLGR